MIKKLFHTFGIHDWKYHYDFFMHDRRECSICHKIQKRKRSINVDEIFDEQGKFVEWKDVDVGSWYVRN